MALRSIGSAMLLALLAAAPGARAQADWAPCASEGEVCRFQGEALVRFGIEGRFAFRVARNRVLCDVEEFGDPAPNQRKLCEVSQGWRQDSRYRGWRDPSRNGGGGEWTLCASEGELCRVPGSVRVRYGANGQYAQREATGAIRCINEVFGDPAPGVAKQCEYAGGGMPVGPAPVRPLPVGPMPAGALPWQACARENGECRFRGAAIVRYGASGRYAYREAVNGVPCNSDSFGVDPAPNEPKACALLRGAR